MLLHLISLLPCSVLHLAGTVTNAWHDFTSFRWLVPVTLVPYKPPLQWCNATLAMFGGLQYLYLCVSVKSCHALCMLCTSSVLLRQAAWLFLQAPLSEEFTFRACMLPILVPCLGQRTAVIVCPLFFGVGECRFLGPNASPANIGVSYHPDMFIPGRSLCFRAPAC